MKRLTLLLAAFCIAQSSFSAQPNILCSPAVATPGQLLSSTSVEARSHL